MIEPPQSAGTSNDHFTIIVFGLVSILVVLIPLLFGLFKQFGAVKQAQRDVAEVKYQVKNNHSTNLREEADDRHDENSKKLDKALSKIDDLGVNITGLRSTMTDVQEDVRVLKRSDAQHTEQLEDIERTNDHKFGKGKPRHA